MLEGGGDSMTKGGGDSGSKGGEGIPIRDTNKGTPVESLPFPSESFKSAWSDWKLHRAEIKKKLTPTSITQQLRNFADWGEDRSIAAIRFTIGNGWQGIREPDAPRNSNQSAPTGDVIINGRVFK